MAADSDKHIAGDYSGDRAETYKARRFEGSARMRRLNDREMAFARSLADRVVPGGRVIDVPCGSGRFTEVFAAADYLYSVDLSEDMLDVAREQAPSGLRGEFIQASAMSVPLPDKCVDLAFCMRLFHHIGDPELRGKLFAELVRLSRRWVAASFYRTGSYRYYRKRMMGRRLSGAPIPIETFVEEAAGHGLRLVSVEPSGMSGFFNRSAQTLALFELDSPAGTAE